MYNNKIPLKITTLSNLFIGGSPNSFEIGGIDLYTITDYEGYPYIPASSFKGALRTIVKNLCDDLRAIEIGNSYKNYLCHLQNENRSKEHLIPSPDQKERIERMKNRFEKEIKRASAECLFGIEGFNHTPKLIFNDFMLTDKKGNPFSIDTKNTITKADESEAPTVIANPRTYKTVRSEVDFCGDIYLYQIEQLEISPQTVIEFVKHAIKEFNSGLYRLGNSGSRGYGRIEIDIVSGCV